MSLKRSTRAIGNEVALDTNQAVAILNGAPQYEEWMNGFSKVYLPVPVLGELRFGALNSQQQERNLARIEQLSAKVSILNATSTTAQAYAEVRVSLKAAGRPIPENDLWIAAICVQHGIPLATDDSHFSYVERLEVNSGPKGENP